MPVVPAKHDITETAGRYVGVDINDGADAFHLV